jgi:hypothetical protein
VLNSERSEVSQAKARAEMAEDDDVIMSETVDVEAEVEIGTPTAKPRLGDTLLRED